TSSFRFPGALLIAAALTAIPIRLSQPVASGAGRPRATLPISAATRLLVVAPHPDDEVIAAAGVIQRVREMKGRLRVVYLTDGEGYPQGVRVEKHLAVPKPSDYQDYGRERKDEARHALRVLGVDS